MYIWKVFKVQKLLFDGHNELIFYFMFNTSYLIFIEINNGYILLVIFNTWRASL